MAGWTQALAHNGLRLQSKGPEEKLTVGETTLVITIRPLLQEERRRRTSTSSRRSRRSRRRSRIRSRGSGIVVVVVVVVLVVRQL